jgi:DNA replication protein DnaC
MKKPPNAAKSKDNPKNPSEPQLLERILEGLDVVRLPEMRRALEQAFEEPQPHQDRLAWLWRLLEPQIKQRLEGRVERRIHDARLPARKTFEAFDFAFQPSLDRDFILELATLRFVEQGKNLLLAGMSGTGKSHIALALALRACSANRRVLYTTSADMLGRLNASLADDSLVQAIKPYVRAELLVIDEVGLEQVERKEASRSGLMQKVLLPRYNEHRSSIITSNVPWEAWGDYLDDHLGATALIDRLLHRSHVIVINGPSYREWAHRKETESPGGKTVRETAT